VRKPQDEDGEAMCLATVIFSRGDQERDRTGKTSSGGGAQDQVWGAAFPERIGGELCSDEEREGVARKPNAWMK
jgi:hypothetical protein